MTTSSRKNYNVMALRGADVDDMELVEDYGMPADYAYTPKVNEFMLDKIYNDNIAEGMDPKQAMKNRQRAMNDIKALMK